MTIHHNSKVLNVLLLAVAFCSSALASEGLVLEKSAPQTVGAGGTIVYNLDVLFEGVSGGEPAEVANNVVVTDQLPANAKFLNARIVDKSEEVGDDINWVATLPNPLEQGGTVTFTRAELPEGVEVEFEITVLVNDDLGLGETVVNTASAAAQVDGEEITAGPETTTTTITVENDLVRICPTVLAYNVTVQNPSQAPIVDGLLKIALPENATYIRTDADADVIIVEQPAVGEQGGVVILTATTLPAGETRSASIRVAPISQAATTYAFQGITNSQLQIGGGNILTSIAPFGLVRTFPAPEKASRLVDAISVKYCCDLLQN